MAALLIHTIRFHYQVSFYFPARNQMKFFLASVFKKEKRQLKSLAYIFCTDEYLLQLNQQFLNHDTLTDIITFELSSKGAPVEGEIYISIDRIRENASSFKTSFPNELNRVMIHGILHLCGYKDKSQKDKLVMKQKEEQYLSLLSVSRETNSG